MNSAFKNAFSCMFLRPWLGVPLGIWLAVSIIYYWWLISRINVLENQNSKYRSQLKTSEDNMKNIYYIQRYTTYQIPVIPDTIGTLCETIHISLVCMGKCTRSITPMLKSLLDHRQNPLHFHFVVDSGTEQIVEKLFDTWNLPDVKYSCLNAQNRLIDLRWIPNSHYSGIFALVKLLIPNILPKWLKQVIILDSDLTFLCDVAELWLMFRNMTDDQMLGLVENESNWYYETNRWPALGRGYNTGVMLLDLEKVRSKLNWSSLWLSVVEENLATLKQTTLADQDVINSVIKKHPHIVYNISCQYNVQMSSKTLAKACYGEDRSDIKIVHWNSPSKYNVKIRDADFFRNIHQSYVNLDGNLLREKLHKCLPTEATPYKMNASDPCANFRVAQQVKLRTHIYYMDYAYTGVDHFDVTLVVQLSVDRLQFLERLVKYWEGPLSAAIYLSDCDITQFESFIRDWSDTLSIRKNIGYHLVFKHESVHYPVNYLRNVALENVRTPYVFLLDVDFVPMAGLYQHLRDSIQLINPYPQKKCLVVAAFETQRYRASPPRTKRTLAARLGADVAPFRAREWPRGHRPTNYTKWLTAEKPYEVEWQSDYEPYLVAHRSIPKFDTRFSGFGWNKVSHSVALRARGFRLAVLPGAFAVHTPHAPSRDIAAFRARPRYRLCLALLKQEFMEDLKKNYNISFDEPSKPDPVYLGQAKKLILNQAKELV